MNIDVLIIGAGAAGLFCAMEAGKRGKNVIVIDHAERIAEKIRISGGGRCNFTNLHCSPADFITKNNRFHKSALKRFTQHDFIAMVERYNIPYHEKTLGQLFCDNSAKDIIDMLKRECLEYGVDIRNPVSCNRIEKTDNGFLVDTTIGGFKTKALVIATGGPSIPKMGSSSFGYEVANQFGIDVVPPRAGLVPLVFDPAVLTYTKELSGIAIDPVEVKSQSGKVFREAMLFTHRGISGPAILQISSYWSPGEEITINMAPDLNVFSYLKESRRNQPRLRPHTLLGEFLPKRLAQKIIEDSGFNGNIADLSDKKLQDIATRIQNWKAKPSGSEGYRTAEVTLGGIDTDEVSSRSFECHKVKGLYFIGELLDVTGHLGGFNFQWAWSSGWCAGQEV